MGIAPPYFLRLRIYAKQINYFYRKLRALPPVYDRCPVRCIAPEADRLNGCPDCDFTIFYRKLKDNYYRLLKKDLTADLMERGVELEKATQLAETQANQFWTFENLQADYRSLSEIEALAGTETAERPGGLDPSWNIRTRTAIDIIREERYIVRREVEYEERQTTAAADRAKAKTK